MLFVVHYVLTGSPDLTLDLTLDLTPLEAMLGILRTAVFLVSGVRDGLKAVPCFTEVSK